MSEKSPHLRTFFLIASFFAALTALWLVLTPSKSSDLVFLSFTVERIVLISFSLLSFIIIFICTFFSKGKYFQYLFKKIYSSIGFFLIFFFTDIFFLVVILGTLINEFGPWNTLLQRLLPILVFGLFITTELILFQQCDGNGLPGRILTSWFFPQDGQSDYLTPNGRDRRLDFLRGFFIIVMIVDHIADFSPLFYITLGGIFFTSAAEGFFLISGVVSGIVYFKVIQNKGLWSAVRKSWLRALTIYLFTISLSLIILLLGKFINNSLIENIPNQGKPLFVLADLLTFRVPYYQAHILIVYCLLFLVFPLVLILLKNGKTWLVCILSLGYYSLSLIFPAMNWFPIFTFINFPGVQFLFILGVVIGYHHLLEKLQPYFKKRWLVIFGIGFLALIVFWNILGFGFESSKVNITSEVKDALKIFFNRQILAPGRIIASIITFGFLYLGVTYCWKRLKQFIGWLIIPFGENSLVAYSFHVLIAAVYIIVAAMSHYDNGLIWINGIIQLLSILIIWVLLKWQILSPHSKQKKYFYIIPPVLITLYLILIPSF